MFTAVQPSSRGSCHAAIVAVPPAPQPDAPLPIRCPECLSLETMRTSEHTGETFHLCHDCDHVWGSEGVPRIVPLMTHSVQRASPEQRASTAAKRSGMPFHKWRRTHGTDIVSTVHSVDGFGSWRVSVSLDVNPSVAVILPTTVALLHSAQAKADALARRTFDHTCGSGTCGEWLPC